MPIGIYKHKSGLEYNHKKGFKKGSVAWNKGLKGLQPWHNISGLKSDYWKGKVRYDMLGENHFAWKGNKAGYRSIHTWIQNKLGKAIKCKYCGKESNGHKIHWANINHKYKRELTDWISLCASCHGKHDKEINQKH